jgi:hypothetical protein
MAHLNINRETYDAIPKEKPVIMPRKRSLLALRSRFRQRSKQ